MAMVEMEDCRCDHPGDLSSLCWFGVRDGGLGSARAVSAADSLLARVPRLPRRPAADAIRTGCGRSRLRGGLAEPCPAAARRAGRTGFGPGLWRTLNVENSRTEHR